MRKYFTKNKCEKSQEERENRRDSSSKMEKEAKDIDTDKKKEVENTVWRNIRMIYS